MNEESRRTQRHDDSPNQSTIPPYSMPHGEIAAPYLAWALAYADLGYPVLPLVERGKKPMTSNGVLDATTNKNQIRGWWKQNRLANIGLACGVAFDVLDFDVRIQSDGTLQYTSAPALKRLNELGMLASAFGISQTAHGGLHVYVPPSGGGNHQLSQAHVDYRGYHGYVVAPPSCVVTEHGARGTGWYTWLQFPFEPIAGAAPVQWEAVIRALVGPIPSRPVIPSRGQSSEGLAGFVAGCKPGSRNNATYWALRKAQELNVSLGPICQAALKSGLKTEEIQTIVTSAIKGHTEAGDSHV